MTVDSVTYSPGIKICTGCQKVKSPSDFHQGRGYKGGVKAQCKKCDADRLKRWRASNPEQLRAQTARRHNKQRLEGTGSYDPSRRAIIALQKRDAYLIRKYGISLEEYLALHETQKGLCAACGNPPISKPGPGQGKHPELVVDHCHTSGKVRGLLCDPCNRAAGCVGDDPERLRKLALYLLIDRC